MNVYILETRDAWNTYNSADIVGIYSSIKSAIKMAKKVATKNNAPLTEYEVQCLWEIQQTQGRNENFTITGYRLNDFEL